MKPTQKRQNCSSESIPSNFHVKMPKAEVNYLFIYFGETRLNSIKSQSYALLEMWLL